MEYIEGYNKYGYNMDVMRRIKKRFDKEENANLRDIILLSSAKCLITYKKDGEKEQETIKINEIFKDAKELKEFLS